jgi:transcriptional regulator with GAF, ATPase, and Fis domain
VASEGPVFSLVESLGAAGGTAATSDRDQASRGRRPGGSLQEIERCHILDILTRCGWKIKGKGNAAERLGLHPSTLRFRMNKLGIRRSRTSRDQ